MPELVFSAATLQLLSAAALAFSVLVYVLLDGTDLGVGMLYAFHRAEEDRHVIALSLLPIWDGNETWLVLGGGGLLALFPIAYAILAYNTFGFWVFRGKIPGQAKGPPSGK